MDLSDNLRARYSAAITRALPSIADHPIPLDAATTFLVTGTHHREFVATLPSGIPGTMERVRGDLLWVLKDLHSSSAHHARITSWLCDLEHSLAEYEQRQSPNA
jgi:hypothetical protein